MAVVTHCRTFPTPARGLTHSILFGILQAKTTCQILRHAWTLYVNRRRTRLAAPVSAKSAYAHFLTRLPRRQFRDLLRRTNDAWVPYMVSFWRPLRLNASAELY